MSCSTDILHVEYPDIKSEQSGTHYACFVPNLVDGQWDLKHKILAAFYVLHMCLRETLKRKRLYFIVASILVGKVTLAVDASHCIMIRSAVQQPVMSRLPQVLICTIIVHHLQLNACKI